MEFPHSFEGRGFNGGGPSPLNNAPQFLFNQERLNAPELALAQALMGQGQNPRGGRNIGIGSGLTTQNPLLGGDLGQLNASGGMDSIELMKVLRGLLLSTQSSRTFNPLPGL